MRPAWRLRKSTDHFPDQAPPLAVSSALKVKVVQGLNTCFVVTAGLIGSFFISIGRGPYDTFNVYLAYQGLVRVVCTFEGHSPMTMPVDEGHCDFCYRIGWTRQSEYFIGSLGS